MGCFPKMSAATCSQPAATPRPTGNPNPYRFKLKKVVKVGLYWVVHLNYPDCTNFEGDKVLVMKRNPSEMGAIDPHFQKDGYILARFEPTKHGFYNAEMFATAMQGDL